MHTRTDSHALTTAPPGVGGSAHPGTLAPAVELPPKSRETLLAIADGLQKRRLAQRLGISPNTIWDRTARLRVFFDCPQPSPLSALVALGYETGAIPLPALSGETILIPPTEAALVPYAAAGVRTQVMAEQLRMPFSVVQNATYVLRQRIKAVNGPHAVKRLHELGLVTPAGRREA
ncbi:hypothetical protein ACFWPV_09915 [Streptomyces uncialis]|uniref:hypothetical protein n=1 Tax=Streptomyces uncialis TaxID=1048205 RepID=UPI00366511BB